MVLRIDVIPATAADRVTVEHLYQFYVYDFTGFKSWDVGPDGRFVDAGLDGCWTEDDRRPFLVRVDGELAGFAIVDGYSHLTGERRISTIADFFVLRRYRRLGVGEHVARELFDRFPGRWEVAQLAENTVAQAFWRRVIDRYTGGRFTEVQWDDDRWRGPVQTFDNTPKDHAPACVLRGGSGVL
ncbi:MAG TPA: GNAT family N-acetyltransferase [Thermomicrobiales bacterium]|nr:GNAT family N-acetyltransferase [Thermomicrobiales bacterium]